MNAPEKLITTADAVKILGISKAGLGKLAKKGLLRVVRQGRVCRYLKSEVLHLKKLRDRGLRPRDLGKDILFLKHKMGSVRLLAEHVSFRLNIQEKYQTIPNADLLIWYEEASAIKYLDDLDIRESLLKKWLSRIQNIHEQEMKHLKLLRGDPAPFAPFLALCDKLITLTRLYGDKTTPSSITYRGWGALFLTARAILKERAVAFLSEEPPDLAPIARVELLTDLSKYHDLANLTTRINGSPESGAKGE